MLALVGDIHGNFYRLRELSERVKDRDDISAIIQVGDFGYYPNLIRQLEMLKFPKSIYWIDGNHEHFDLFMDITEVTEMHENVFYVPRGTIMSLDNKKIAFLGGAASVDKDIRRGYGMDWSPKENISPEHILRFGDETSVDMMITHCPPQWMIQKHFDPLVLERYFGLSRTWRDPNADIVEQVWAKFGKPSLYCGHMHRSVVDGNCRILTIDEILIVP